MTAQKKNTKKRALRRSARVHYRVRRASGRPRVTVFRSSRHIYAQIIDDNKQVTLATASSLITLELSGNKADKAKAIGKELASKAQKIGVNSVVFDRGRYLYHGRVKALADGLREGGLAL